MKLIIGGYAQGKLAYVLEKYRLQEDVVWDGILPDQTVLGQKTIVIDHLHQWVKNRILDDGCPEREIEAFLNDFEDCILISNEIGNGIVPLDAFAFEEGDRKLLANIIYCEAGGEPYEGKVAVGAVVINRVLSTVYPNTVVGVIYQNKQFSPVASGRLALALANDKATESCYRAADEAMSGVTNVGQCVYFRTPIPGLEGIRIGGHIFY